MAGAQNFPDIVLRKHPGAEYRPHSPNQQPETPNDDVYSWLPEFRSGGGSGGFNDGGSDSSARYVDGI